ncbi:UNVERIFIED_CONTAM: hypothetical protein ABID98_000641 [Brevibacillus sp. OAP136]
MELREGTGDATSDFVIEATPVEIGVLKDLFQQAALADVRSYGHAHILVSDVSDEDHMEYDQALTHIYEMLHKLGTKKTQRDIESLGLLTALKGYAGNNIHNPDLLRGTVYTPPEVE